jgi:hypothetical protein
VVVFKYKITGIDVMSKIKIVAVDLDGTVLDKNKEISRENASCSVRILLGK